MPLYKEWKIGNHGLAAIWKVDELESFFAERTGIIADQKNEKRRIEHLAGRFLLQHLEEDFPIMHIGKDEHDKPRLPNNQYYFSISHSWPYIAAVIDPYSEAGIDIQVWHATIERIQYKFLSPEEQDLFKNDPQLLTLAWTAKEAAYKWNGRRGVDFIEHLPIENFSRGQDKNHITIYLKSKIMPKMVFIESIINTDFSCSYVTNAQNWAIW